MNAPEPRKHLAQSHSGELARIVRVNEEIKSIVATAFRINLNNSPASLIGSFVHGFHRSFLMVLNSSVSYSTGFVRT